MVSLHTMAVQITSLNSGSNGNCYYIGNEQDAVLVDAGISCKETEKRMAALQLDISKVRAVFISHEHTDHIKGLTVLATKYQLPVFISKHTYTNSGLNIPQEQLRWFSGETVNQVMGISVHTFSKKHDAKDPHSFVVETNGVSVGVFTDIGTACQNVEKFFGRCHAAFLEANYDEAMLENGRYPLFLKNRIRGGNGHLSNNQALEIFARHRPSFMTHLLLAHLSKDNNDPVLVQSLFEAQCPQTKIVVASRFHSTPVFELLANGVKTTTPAQKKYAAVLPVQMALFNT